jgi:hypothetical protein
MVITLMLWEMMSCSSRAMRARSLAMARRSCSACCSRSRVVSPASSVIRRSRWRSTNPTAQGLPYSRARK